MATGVGDIFLDLKLNKQPFEKGLNETRNSAGKMGSLIGGKIGLALAGAVTTAMAGISFVHLISQAREIGDTIDKMSQKLGMSTQAYQEWDYIMEICGTSIDSLQMGMKTLASSAETGKEAFEQLGISQAELSSLSQEQLFSRTITALQNVEDTTKRTYLAGQLLGRGATELGALLNMSAQDTVALRQNLYSLGGVMSQTAINNSAQLSDALTNVRMSFRNITNTIAESVLPVLTKAIYGVIIPAIQKASSVLRYFIGLWRSVFGGIAKGTSFVGKLLGKVSGGFKSAFGKAQQKQNGKIAKSLGGIGKGTGGVGKSAKKAKKAVKELTRELMGFDKINKLAKKNTDAGAGGGGGGGGGGLGDIGGFGDELAGVDDSLLDLSKLKDKLSPFITAIGDIFKALLRLAKAVGKALAPVGKWIWNHLIKPLGRLIGMAIIAVLEGIAGAIELLALFIEKHPKISATLMTIAGGMLAIIKAGGVLGIISKFSKLFAILGRAIMAHPIGLLLTAIALAIGYIYKNWDKIKKTKFGKVLIAVGKRLKEVGNVLKTYFGERIKATIKFAKTAWNVLKKVATFLSKTFKKAVELASHPLETLKNAWAGIKSKTVELKADVGDGVQNILDGFSNTVATIKVGLEDNFSGAWNKIKDVWNGIKNKAVETAISLEDKFKSAWDKIKSTWDSVKNKTATAKAVLSDKFSKTWKKIKDAWDKLKNKTATLKVNIKTVLAKGWNGIVKKLRNAKLPLISKFGKKLPLLAQGGWVGKNTPQLAVVGDNRHESEIVAPDSKLMAMARQASQEAVANSSNAQVVSLLTQLLRAVNGLDTNVYLDGKEITRNTIKNINQQTRTTGQSPILV